MKAIILFSLAYIASIIELCQSFHSPSKPHPSSSTKHHHWHQPSSPWTAAHTRTRPLFSSLSVYDNVFTNQQCQLLHQLTIEHGARSSDGSSIFVRYPHHHHHSSTSTTLFQHPSQINNNTVKQQYTPLEAAIDSLLTSINDTSPIVEYWSRKNYINMDAHADIDEDYLKDEGDYSLALSKERSRALLASGEWWS
eukprot:scaffold1414_cov204-Alexandrium_tamarense.AAC.5